jgi:hypothetical protein
MMTLSITTLIITTQSITTLNMMTLSITIPSIRTLSLKGLFTTHGINDTQHSNTDIMLNVVMMSVAFYLILC